MLRLGHCGIALAKVCFFWTAGHGCNWDKDVSGAEVATGGMSWKPTIIACLSKELAQALQARLGLCQGKGKCPCMDADGTHCIKWPTLTALTAGQEQEVVPMPVALAIAVCLHEEVPRIHTLKAFSAGGKREADAQSQTQGGTQSREPLSAFLHF
jgi:hypothetical protein